MSTILEKEFGEIESQPIVPDAQSIAFKFLGGFLMPKRAVHRDRHLDQ